MLSDFRKSINYIIYERTTSPFWGAFIFSWLICNWKIVFTVIIISEDKLPVNKIDYISTNYTNWKALLLYPFISTFILIAVLPLLGNAAYWITIVYAKWRIDKKNNVEKQQLLTIEQSISLRSSLKAKNDNFILLLEEKEHELKILKVEIDEIKKQAAEPQNTLVNKEPENSQKQQLEEWLEEFENFKKNPLFSKFGDLIGDIAAGKVVDHYSISFNNVGYFDSQEIIKKVSNKIYDLTEKGRYFAKLYNQIPKV